MSLKRWFNRID